MRVVREGAGGRRRRRRRRRRRKGSFKTNAVNEEDPERNSSRYPGAEEGGREGARAVVPVAR